MREGGEKQDLVCRLSVTGRRRDVDDDLTSRLINGRSFSGFTPTSSTRMMLTILIRCA